MRFQMRLRKLLGTAKDVTGRIRRRVRYKLGALVEEPVRDVVFVSVQNASTIAEGYSGVVAETLIEDSPMTAVIPKHLDGESLAGIRPFSTALSTVLLDIRNDRFSLRNRVVWDDQQRILFPASATKEQVLFFNEHAQRPRRHLAGTVAYLSNTWIDNYYHWMQLALPLLRLYRLLRPAVEINYYYVGHSQIQKTITESLLEAGVSPDQIVAENCTADRILVALPVRPEQPVGFNYRDQFGHEFVRSIFRAECLVGSTDSPRRIFVRRGATRMRRLINEDEVIKFLSHYGFSAVSMDGRRVIDQAKLFANAEVIVGVHGAALTNLLFIQPGTKVIEIFPCEFHEPGMFTAASYSKADYYMMLGSPLDPSSDKKALRMQHTILDLKKLERILQKADVKKIVSH